MVKSLNGTYFQYWTKVMLDIQKANAIGDSPDFPIIKVSVFHFYWIISRYSWWIIGNDDKFSFTGCRSKATTDVGYFCCILEKIKIRSQGLADRYRLYIHKFFHLGITGYFWPLSWHRRKVYKWSIWLFLWPVRRQRSQIKVTKAL